jgi:hypothetical protein
VLHDAHVAARQYEISHVWARDHDVAEHHARKHLRQFQVVEVILRSEIVQHPEEVAFVENLSRSYAFEYIFIFQVPISRGCVYLYSLAGRKLKQHDEARTTGLVRNDELALRNRSGNVKIRIVKRVLNSVYDIWR